MLFTTLWSTEFSEGWQGEGGVCDELGRVETAADVAMLAILNTT